MALRASSLQSTNTLAINREIGSQYDVILNVSKHLAEIDTLANADISGLINSLNEAKDFTGITVVTGETPSWDAANKILTVPVEKGDTGENGRGIVDIELTGTVGLTKTYTINYTDGASSTFTVINGANGTNGVAGKSVYQLWLDAGNEGTLNEFLEAMKGPEGNTGPQGIGIQGPAGIDGRDLTVEQISYDGNGVFTWQFSDGTSYTTPDLRGPQGATGQKGDKGDQGISVHHLKATSTTDPEGDFGTFGELDTYTFYGDASETINLGHYVVRNGITPDMTEALGIMRRATYDTNSNGIVDNAEKLNGLTAQEIQASITDLYGQPNGIATLDNAGLVPASQLPSYVDDVIEVQTKAELPIEGEPNKIYVVVNDETSNGDTTTYRWTGTIYAVVSNTLNASDVKALYEANPDTNAYTDAEKVLVDVGQVLETTATTLPTAINEIHNSLDAHKVSTGEDHTYIDQDVTTTATPTFAGIVTEGLVDGRDLSVDGAKLDTIEENAKDDQTGAEIKALYEAELDTNAYTDAEKSKLTSIEEGATADQTAEEIEALYESNLDTNKYTDAEKARVDISTGLTTVAQTLPRAVNELDGRLADKVDTATLDGLNVFRADKVLASKDVANLIYSGGNLVKIRYTNDTDVDYEVLSYVGDDLTNVAHYVGGVLQGNTVLTYSGGDLVSSIFIGV